MSFARWTVLVSLVGIAVPLAGCMASHDDGPGGVRAVNLHTGEEREFADAESVPGGWVVCPDGECPEPSECAGLDETACLARIDCDALYSEVSPPECDVPPGSGRPVPAYCGTLPFISCSDRRPDGCGVPPLCLVACAVGTHQRVDPDGCVRTCDCVPDGEECGPIECGPAPGVPTWTCEDGSIGGSTGRCYRHDDGVCGWEIRDCPMSPPPPPPPPAECAVGECGPALGIPAIVCEDGSIGGNTGRCLRGRDGVCGWEIRECPPGGECTPEECGPAPLSDPMCPSGESSTRSCERSPEGVCGWHFSCG